MSEKHSDIHHLAPGCVNGSLSPEEHDAVARAAETDSVLAADIAAFRKIAEAVKETRDEAFSPSEFGWRRLQRALGETENAPTLHAAPANENAPFWRYAAALLGVVALGQAVFIAMPTGKPKADQYATAGAATAQIYTVKVRFQDDAEIGDITTLLDVLGGSFVSGPSARGLYQVSFDSDEKRVKALTQLNARQDLVAIAAKE